MTAHDFPSFCWCPFQKPGFRKTKFIALLCNRLFKCLTATRFLDDSYPSRSEEGLVCLELWAERHDLCHRWISGNREWNLRKGIYIKWSLPLPWVVSPKHWGVGGISAVTWVFMLCNYLVQSTFMLCNYPVPLAVLLAPLIFKIHTEFPLMPTCFYHQVSPAGWAVIWSSGHASSCGICQRRRGEAQVLEAAVSVNLHRQQLTWQPSMAGAREGEAKRGL